MDTEFLTKLFRRAWYSLPNTSIKPEYRRRILAAKDGSQFGLVIAEMIGAATLFYGSTAGGMLAPDGAIGEMYEAICHEDKWENTKTIALMCYNYHQPKNDTKES